MKELDVSASFVTASSYLRGFVAGSAYGQSAQLTHDCLSV
jgi:hypothetical protein